MMQSPGGAAQRRAKRVRAQPQSCLSAAKSARSLILAASGSIENVFPQPFRYCGYVEGKLLMTPRKSKAKKPTPKSAKGQEPEVDPRFAPIVAAFAYDRRVKCGRMFSSNSVLNVNGKIFAMLTKGNLVVKLPKVRVDEMVSRGQGTHFDPGHGRLMKEWVVVGPGKLNWIDLAREARGYVKGSKK